MRTLQFGHTKLMIIDDMSPEDGAMLQAIYSRSAASAETHLEKVRKSGSGKFMSTYYVGYGHKSIADCGTTTMFIENVSLLAAKAIQDWPLYSGQETSTRYIDFATRHIVNPIGTDAAQAILNDWMHFYRNSQERVAGVVTQRYPMKAGEKPETYEKAVNARTFDILRGFLPAGVTTQLSWHSNLRQAGDHLTLLTKHPSDEIRGIAKELQKMLGEQYSASGLGLSLPSVSGVEASKGAEQDERAHWERLVAARYTYLAGRGAIGNGMTFWAPPDMVEALRPYDGILANRPRGCVLPHFMTDLGQCHFTFLLDFGSFRDIQRHRNGVCRMPLLTTEHGFETWYLEQLGDELRKEAEALIEKQTARAFGITDDPVIRQYYLALGFRVPTSVTYGLPATVYTLELRSGKMIHPTLRKKIHMMITSFQQWFPTVKLHVDLDPDDWDIRRGTQTISEKA